MWKFGDFWPSAGVQPPPPNKQQRQQLPQRPRLRVQVECKEFYLFFSDLFFSGGSTCSSIQQLPCITHLLQPFATQDGKKCRKNGENQGRSGGSCARRATLGATMVVYTTARAQHFFLKLVAFLFSFLFLAFALQLNPQEVISSATF